MTTAVRALEGQEQARPPRPGQVEGRVALVTGGTRGIGAATCRALADEGAHLAAGYWRDDEDVEKFLTAMAADDPGRRITVHEGNIGSADDCRRVLREVIDQHGRVDILVNNAGITIDRTVAKMTDDDWHKVIAVNLSGAFFMAQAAARHMVQRGTGRIINVLLGHRRDRQHRPGQLRRLQVRPVRPDQIAGPRGGIRTQPGAAPGR